MMSIQALQRTAAAMLVWRSCLSLSAAAAAELAVRRLFSETTPMTLRCLIGLVVVLVTISGVHGQYQGPGLAQVLVVAEVDQPNGRILFEAWGVETRDVEQRGKAVPATVAVKVKVVFSLKDGKAITADGKAVKDADLWKRIEVGKPVLILSPEARDSGEQLDKAIRALLKDDTILLVGATKRLPKGNDSPKKP
jgi:hypothetical protein